MKKTSIFFVIVSILFLAASCASSKGDAADAMSSMSLAGKDAAAITDIIQPIADGKKTLVSYFSNGSSTKRVATDLAILYGADLEAIQEIKPRNTKFIDFMTAGFQGTFKIASRIDKPVSDPSAFDRVIVLTPVWSWSLSPPVRAWLKLMKGKLPPATAFVTVSGDTEPDKIVADMKKVSGTVPVVFMGFRDKDFAPENRESYAAKLTTIIEKLK
jgi:hypothetical protein